MRITSDAHWGVLLAAKTLLVLLVLASGFKSVSGDAMARTLVAYQWSTEPFFVLSDFPYIGAAWLPLTTWLNGALLRVWPDLWLTPLLVSVGFTLLALYFLYRLAEILFGRRVAILSGALYAVLPWGTWLGLSGGMSEPIYFALIVGAFYFFVRWHQSESEAFLWAAATGFALAGMVRPFAWCFGGLFALYILAVAVTRRYPVTTLLLQRGGAAGLAMLGLLFWLVVNYAYFGDPLYFLNNNIGNTGTVGFRTFGARFLQYPGIFLLVSPALAGVYFAAILAIFVRRDTVARDARDYLGLTLAAFFALALAGGVGFSTSSSPQRYVLVFHMLFSPLMAWFLVWLLSCGGIRRRLVITGLLLFFSTNVCLNFFYIDRYQFEAAAGQFVRTLIDDGILGRDDRIVTEFGAGLLAGHSDPSDRIEPGDTPWVQAAFLMGFSNRPSQFVERNWLLGAEDSVRRDIGDPEKRRLDRVTLAIARSSEVLEWLSGEFAPACQIGPYYVLARAPTTVPCPQVDYPGFKSVAGGELGAGYRVESYAVYPALLPKSVLIRIEMPPQGDSRGRRLVIRAGDSGATEVYAIREGLSRPVFFFPRRATLPLGEYRLQVSLLDSSRQTADEWQPASGDQVSVGPVLLVGSKRSAVKAILAGSNYLPELALRLALTL